MSDSQSNWHSTADETHKMEEIPDWIWQEVKDAKALEHERHETFRRFWLNQWVGGGRS